MFPGSSRFGAGIVDNKNAFPTNSTVQSHRRHVILPIKRASTTGGIPDKTESNRSTFSGILSKAVGLTGRPSVLASASRMAPQSNVISPAALSSSAALSPSRIFSPTKSGPPTRVYSPTRQLPTSRAYSSTRESSPSSVLSHTKEVPGRGVLSPSQDRAMSPTREHPSFRIFSPTRESAASRMSPLRQYSNTRLYSPLMKYPANRMMSPSRNTKSSVTSNCSSLHSRSSSPVSCSSRSCSVMSTEASFPRRVFPQMSAKVNCSDALEGKEDAPVVFNAGMSFVMGVKNQAVRQQFKPRAAHLHSSTASSVLSSKIRNFLRKTDHVMEEWKRLGRKDTDMQSLATLPGKNGEDRCIGRSRSATNILIKGYQLYSKTNTSSMRSASVTRASEEDTFSEVDEVKILWVGQGGWMLRQQHVLISLHFIECFAKEFF